jgi:hypothetical protein
VKSHNLILRLQEAMKLNILTPPDFNLEDGICPECEGDIEERCNDPETLEEALCLSCLVDKLVESREKVAIILRAFSSGSTP